MTTFSKLLIDIEKKYFSKVNSGYFTNSGSFIANDENGNDFFANKEIVDKKLHLFNQLKNNQESLWILVEEQTWSDKWDNKKVQNILTISNKEEDCKNYKTDLFLQLIVKVKLIEVQTSIHESIQKSALESKDNINQIKILQKILNDLNSKKK